MRHSRLSSWLAPPFPPNIGFDTPLVLILAALLEGEEQVAGEEQNDHQPTQSRIGCHRGFDNDVRLSPARNAAAVSSARKPVLTLGNSRVVNWQRHPREKGHRFVLR
jgi:hypothetical protein